MPLEIQLRDAQQTALLQTQPAPVQRLHLEQRDAAQAPQRLLQLVPLQKR